MADTGRAMIDIEVEYGATAEVSAEAIRAQLELLVRDDVFRSSKRSVAFVRYVVEQTLNGSADQIKERTIGVEVFGRDPSYDTNLDHIVRTAATELRKRLATYYVDEKHRSELRMGLVPGSYIPRFTIPNLARHTHAESVPQLEAAGAPCEVHSAQITFDPIALPASGIVARPAARPGRRWIAGLALAGAIGIAAALGYGWLQRTDPEDLFWMPVVDTPGTVLLAVGGHPDGPPTLPEVQGLGVSLTPVPSSDSSQTVPFADTVTIARVTGALAARNKKVLIRQGSSSSFSDLREGAVVLIGAFNNE